MEYEELREEYSSFVNKELNKLFKDSLPEGKNMYIYFRINNISVSIIKEEFIEYLKNLLENKQVFTVEAKIKGVSFKIDITNIKEGKKQGIIGIVLQKYYELH